MTIVLLALAAIAIVVVIAAPLRRSAQERDDAARAGRIADLQAAKLARYRAIADAELDHRTGKLSDADWRRTDRELRAEAAHILHELDDLGADG